MSLRKDAIELSKILHEILESTSGSRSAYLTELARKIGESVAAYDRAVFDKRSREEASDALAQLAEVVSALSAASVKGELDTFKGDLLERYWRLHTIFRESRYRDQTL
jgi:hypothetical protein